MSGDLAAFLLARIDEDNALATVTESPQHATHLYDAPGTYSPRCPTCVQLGSAGRLLSECESKRAIIRLHFRTAYLPGDDPDDGCVICGGWPCDTLRALAAPYAGHPDFDPAWRL